MIKSKKLVSKKHQDYEIELIINKNLFQKNLITQEMYNQAQDTLLKLISIEKNKNNDLCFSKKCDSIIGETT